MSFEPLACDPLTRRRMINFCPGVQSSHFINYTPDDKITLDYRQKRVKDLKEKVRKELMATAGKPSQQLSFIDAVQRLGVAYYYEEDIEKELGDIYDNYHGSDDQLYYVSLRFRLLRQQGYHVSCDVFKRFRDENGNFKKCLINDVEGMLGLYEAAHLRVQGEDILDEALAFTATHLKALVEHLDYPLAEKVNRALYRPIRRCLERLEARFNISIYQDEASHSKALLELAKLDFNLLQSLYKKELSHITRWWKDLDFSSKLPFFRDRVVETYFWISVACFEPQYSYARRIQTKLLALITVIDDMYDAYGTPGELELFTEAIERWDINDIDRLPEYMKPCYQAMLDAYKEIEQKENEERPYCVHYAKEAMKSSVRAYHNEVKWFHGECIPSVEEYLSVALVTSDVTLFTIVSFVGMGSMATKEIFDWVLSDPKIMKATSTIMRLMDDMASHKVLNCISKDNMDVVTIYFQYSTRINQERNKALTPIFFGGFKFEQERGHAASSVECYMKQHGVSEHHAYQELNKQVENGWKDVNQGCLKPTAIPMHLLSRVLNFARTGDFMYGGRKDLFTNVGDKMNDHITSLFIDPSPL